MVAGGAGTRGSNWRDEAAAELLIRHLPGLDLRGPILLMEDPRSEVATELEVHGRDVETWNRRAFGGRRATPWPPEGPFGTVLLRLPRAKEELDMALHGAAGCLDAGGRILVYGAKDEGIGSVSRRLDDLYQGVHTVGVGGHCRILGAQLRQSGGELRSSLGDWRVAGRLDYGGVRRVWVSYPGVFAHGRLDPGTRLLLDALPELPGHPRVLDYGCGSGAVGAVIQARYPEVRLELLDIDAVALEAARENVPGARILLSDGLPRDGETRFDAIVSNPPFHRGKAEEPGMIHDLVMEAPRILGPAGRMVLVTQRRLPLEETLAGAFGEFAVRAEAGAFRVWEGRAPTWKLG
jgi:16S rRNA (guanine1207-N2)-methyltransferase